MKILHVYKTFYPDTFGGVEKFIDQLAQSAAAQGVQSEILTLTKASETSEIEINGSKVHRVPQNIEIASCPFSIKAIHRLKKLAESADIIHYHFPWPFADMMHFLTRIKKPTVLTYHSDIVKQKMWLRLYNPLMHAFLSKVNCIAATSPNYVATSDVLKKYSDKTCVIPIGIDKNNYPKPSSEKLAYWKNKFSAPFFLFIGNLRYYKGIDFLIEAAKNVDAPIVIVGSLRTRSAELEAKIKTLGLTNVYFLDEIPEEDKAALLTLCYALVMPSHLRSEAFGISLIEGAMYGKPLISCEIGTGTTYVNIHNETGLAVPPRDPQALAEAMQFLITNPSKAKTLGQKAENRFQELFTAQKMAQSYIEIYNKLLSRKSDA